MISIGLLTVKSGLAYTWTLILCLWSASVLSLATNRTIDDYFGDSVTGALPTYSPSWAWAQGAVCPFDCVLDPFYVDLDQVFDLTWNDATYQPGDNDLTITVKFTGVAVYVYNILENDSGTVLIFYIDNEYVGEFTSTPDGSTDLEYNACVYTNNTLSPALHSLRIVATGDRSSVVLFDYIVYTHEDVTAPSPRSTNGLPSSVPSQTTSSLIPSSQPSTSRTPTLTTSTSLPPSTTLSPTISSHEFSTSSSSPTSASTPDVTSSSIPFPSSSRLSGRAISGVIVACIASPLVIVAFLYFLKRRFRPGKLQCLPVQESSHTTATTVSQRDFVIDSSRSSSVLPSVLDIGFPAPPERTVHPYHRNTIITDPSSGASATVGGTKTSAVDGKSNPVMEVHELREEIERLRERLRHDRLLSRGLPVRLDMVHE